MVVAVDVSPQRLDLSEAHGGDGHAILAAANEEEVHAAPNTVYGYSISASGNASAPVPLGGLCVVAQEGGRHMRPDQ